MEPSGAAPSIPNDEYWSENLLIPPVWEENVIKDEAKMIPCHKEWEAKKNTDEDQNSSPSQRIF
jgi:hypothetical protein